MPFSGSNLDCFHMLKYTIHFQYKCYKECLSFSEHLNDILIGILQDFINFLSFLMFPNEVISTGQYYMSSSFIYTFIMKNPY